MNPTVVTFRPTVMPFSTKHGIILPKGFYKDPDEVDATRVALRRDYGAKPGPRRSPIEEFEAKR